LTGTLTGILSKPDSGLDAVADLDHDRLSPRRLGLIERLDTGGGASETTVDVTMAIVRSLTRAFQPAMLVTAVPQLVGDLR
jgi:hypothetical protein